MMGWKKIFRSLQCVKLEQGKINEINFNKFVWFIG